MKLSSFSEDGIILWYDVAITVWYDVAITHCFVLMKQVLMKQANWTETALDIQMFPGITANTNRHQPGYTLSWHGRDILFLRIVSWACADLEILVLWTFQSPQVLPTPCLFSNCLNVKSALSKRNFPLKMAEYVPSYN